MRIAHNDPSKYGEPEKSHFGAGAIQYMNLWGEEDFQTPWLFIGMGVLPPKSGIGHHAHEAMEEMYTIFDNAAMFTHNGNTAELKGPVMVPCFKGDSHGLYNHTDMETQFMNMGVVSPSLPYDCRNFEDDLAKAEPGPSEKLPKAYLDKNLLMWSSSAHQGKGEIGIRELWSHKDFKTSWGFSHHMLIPPACSIGYHKHDTMEACYIILSGSGRITVDDETEEVKAGDLVPNRLGGSHGIYNHTDRDIELISMDVCLEKGKFDSTDLGDDLSDR